MNCKINYFRFKLMVDNPKDVIELEDSLNDIYDPEFLIFFKDDRAFLEVRCRGHGEHAIDSIDDAIAFTVDGLIAAGITSVRGVEY